MENMIERKQISAQEVAFYRVVRTLSGWATAKELADQAGVAHRTGRAYALKFVRLGLLDQADIFPAHRYRWALGIQRDRAYLQRLQQATEILVSDGVTWPEAVCG